MKEFALIARLLLSITTAVVAANAYANNEPTGIELSQESLKLIGSGIDFLVNPIDDFFSGYNQESIKPGKTKVKITYSKLFTKLDGEQSDFSFSFKVILPRTKNKLNLFVEDVNRSIYGVNTSNNSITANSSNPDEKSLQIGLFSIFNINDYLDFSWKTGAKWSGTTADFFATLSSRHKFTITEQWRATFRNEFFAYESIGKGFLSHFRLDNKISNKWNFSSKSELNYYDSEQQIIYNQALNWYQRYSEKRRFSYNISQQWQQPKNEGISPNSYTASVTMRQRIYKKWIYLNTQTGIQFSQANDFEQDPFVLLSIEIYSNDVE